MSISIINRVNVILSLIFAIYLIVLSFVGHNDRTPSIFYFLFWMVMGIVIGYNFCSYLYKLHLTKKHRLLNDHFKKQGRQN